ncbi:MAG: DEAD/DEAH box helicase [Desulfobacteraceae bacterium]|nr:DEAD/DEAH box helicase [Desulfobacteraceae bacterium]
MLEKIGVPEPLPFTPDPYQREALGALAQSDVMVTAPTGAGKTYIAVKAIEKVFQEGGRSWYTSPLKALSNAKYEEFSAVFGPENVGILTGDRKENTQAPIIVGTTEILRNQLYDTMHQGKDIDSDLVVLDEAHYLGDADRGVVWEEVLIYLPARVKILLLSATIQNAQEICDWLEWLRGKPCRWVASYERPVPLYPMFLFPEGELSPLSTRRGMFAKIKSVDRRSFSRNDFPDVPRLMDVLRKANLLPAIFFLKSRSDCEKAASTLHFAPRRAGGAKDSERFRAELDRLLDTYPFLKHHQHLPVLERARVGAHHGGQLPHWKLLLEKLMQEGLLDAIFSTSTVAAGVNFPARTVVVLQSDRFNGKEFVELSATDLLQMTGRAGRRGMDEIGFVLVLPGPFQEPQLIHSLLKSPPDPIASQIRVNHSMVLNLLLSHTPEEIRTLFASSLATFQNLSRDREATEGFQAARAEIDRWLPDAACGSVERLAEVRPRYDLLREQIRRARRFLMRRSSGHSLQGLLAPGRIFYSRRGTPYVAMSHPQNGFQMVEAVRLAQPLRSKRGRVRTNMVGFQRIRGLGVLLDSLPALEDRPEWENLLLRVNSEAVQTPDEAAETAKSLSMDATTREMEEAASQLEALPCGRCALFGPCQKSTSHPFAPAIQEYFEKQAQVRTVQDRLWQSFQKHYGLLREEGYVNDAGRLTEDGQWASKLRLDQPLLISEAIRKGILPSDSPELLAAMMAPFVMDRERQGDIQLTSMVWKYPDLARPFFSMLQQLQPMRNHLNEAGFTTPPMAFWPMSTVHHWAGGSSWESVRQISGVDEGDLAMVILRTAEHLRQIEALAETHPVLAASARKAIRLILREPVLVE